ncbi:MAG: macro domain-containing protein [Anaerolineae bacterium]|jgi:O-acetyl-ADP-ribose deacetylase (regulator of RNase III)
MQTQINGAVLELIQGDITKLDVDAIVNAANERLAHGGGVAAAIARSGGPVIQKESNEWVRKHGRVPTGSAAITSGGNLKVDYVIHAVGPVYGSMSPSRAAQELTSAVKSALQIADEHDLHSIALPAISTGIFGYPLDEAADVMLRAAVDHVKSGTDLKRIAFCLYSPSAFDAFARELEAQIGELDDVTRQARDRPTTK